MTARQFFSVVEIRTKVISVSTYTLATLYTLSTSQSVTWLDAVLLGVAVLCVDMGTTAFNTFYDYMRGVDTPLATVEPGKVLVHEEVAPAYALLISFGLYFLAGITGIAVAVLSSGWIFLAGVLSMMVGFLYNGGPVPISRTPLGELFAGGFLGTVLFLVVYGVHVGEIDAGALVASLPSTLLIAAVLTVNNTCDLEGDRSAGRRTLSIVVGRRAAIVIVETLTAGAYLLVLLMTVSGDSGLSFQSTALPSLPLPAAGVVAAGAIVTAVILVRMHRRGYTHTTKDANMSSIIRVVALFTVVYGAALGLGIMLA